METDCRQVAEKYMDPLFRLAFSYCRNRADAEDVVQEVFLKYLSGKQTFLTEAHLRAWLIRVTINECRDLFRKPFKGRCCSLEEAGEPATFLPEESALLPAKYRVLVHLYYYEDYSLKEIAAMTGISESAAGTRLQRARKKLKDELGGIWENE